MNTLKIAKNGSMVASLLYCVLGLWLLLYPTERPKELYFLTGFLLVCSGILRLIGYLSKDFYCLAFQFDLALGIFTMVTGLCLLTRRQALYPYLSSLFGLLVFNDALFKIQTSLDARRFGLKTLWWIILVAALCTGAGGLLLLFPPSEGLLEGSLAGLAFLADGVLNLLVVFFTVKSRPMDPDR